MPPRVVGSYGLSRYGRHERIESTYFLCSSDRRCGLNRINRIICGPLIFGLCRIITRLEQLGDESGPTGLMRRADPAPVVAVEIFVKEHVIAKVRIGREL